MKMKTRLFGLVLAAFSSLSFAATTTPVQLLNPTGSSAGQAIVSTGSSTAPAWGGVGLNGISAIASNRVIGNSTAATASPTALAMPSCSTTASALNWTTNSGFTCNTTVNSATLNGATFAAPGSIGGTTPGSGAFTTITSSGNDVLTFFNASGQSIPNTTATTVTNWTVSFNRTGSAFNGTTGVYTAPATGIYQISGLVTFGAAAGVSGAIYTVSVVTTAGTAAQARFDQVSTTSAAIQVQIPTVLVSLTAGNTVQIQVSQTTGVSRALSTSGALNYISISRLP